VKSKVTEDVTYVLQLLERASPQKGSMLEMFFFRSGWKPADGPAVGHAAASIMPDHFLFMLTGWEGQGIHIFYQS
jgi:hypothetical protein